MSAMTRQRNDSHGTEFGNWIRQPKEIQSDIGFVATDLDYVWENYKTGQFMLIEEKRYMSEIKFPQKRTFRKIHRYMTGNVQYCGFHLIQFQKTNPDDGDVYWNNKKISKSELLDKLQFKTIDKGGLFGLPSKTINEIMAKP